MTGARPGKEPAVSVRQSDCSSFMLITVTPQARKSTSNSIISLFGILHVSNQIRHRTTTVTKTTTFTTALPVLANRGGLVQRQVTVSPSSVPTYASVCSDAVHYSTACCCWGITASTTTAPTPIITLTTYVTVTASVCPPGYILCDGNCYNLQTSKGNCGSCGLAVSSLSLSIFPIPFFINNTNSYSASPAPPASPGPAPPSQAPSRNPPSAVATMSVARGATATPTQTPPALGTAIRPPNTLLQESL
jgi:hypothetical protein